MSAAGSSPSASSSTKRCVPCSPLPRIHGLTAAHNTASLSLSPAHNLEPARDLPRPSVLLVSCGDSLPELLSVARNEKL